ncbi:glycosyltransferase family 4 protein [Bordetella genomosp. 13]|uniref:glycosyltransferase family 4 protein n=1 Tax=Bordetella genomosp. 13 TaxID=463040 RepID=UPI0011A28809|nr:glycosyltransferase family 4 protein [Bordetella genomosp. 13]
MNPPSPHPDASRRRLLFVVNNPAFFMSHRLWPALAAQAAGWDVHVATMDGPAVADIVARGMTHHVIPLTRSGKQPLQELGSMLAMFRLFRRVRPDVVHLVTIKPVLYGGIAARLAGVPGMVAAISGLGFIFLSAGPKARLVRSVVGVMYRLALGHRNSRVIFQNAADRDTLRRLGAVREGQVVMIRGSGVDLREWPAEPEPPKPVVALMVARLLRDKGVGEFVEAARRLRAQGLEVRMQLAGGIDPGNPASATEADVARWREDGAVEVLGERADVAGLLAASHIAVLPSYREGLPKSLLEAAACGRAVVTTDVPGCRDAITPDRTGLLVPAKDAGALADAIARLAADDALRLAMGRAARELAEQEFDVQDVNRRHLEVYDALVKGASGARQRQRAGPGGAGNGG